MADSGDAPAFRALVFSKTAGYRHESIPDGIAAIERLGKEHGFAVDATEDSGRFTDDNLSRYDVVVWLSTSGNVLEQPYQFAFERYIRAGGGYAGVHGASASEYDWPWYGQLVGAFFSQHPPGTSPGTVWVTDREHPSTEHLPERWERVDEWYNFRTNPRDRVRVLATLDERSFEGGSMGEDHPISWCQLFDGGRSWYTGLGHTSESFSEPEFVGHLLGGIQWAAGVRTDPV